MWLKSEMKETSRLTRWPDASVLEQKLSRGRALEKRWTYSHQMTSHVARNVYVMLSQPSSANELMVVARSKKSCSFRIMQFPCLSIRLRARKSLDRPSGSFPL